MNDSETKYYELVSRMVELIKNVHVKNRKNTRKILWSFIATPIVLLFIMFIMGVPKSTIVLLWLVALFIQCSLLISVEYADVGLMGQLRELLSDDDVLVEILGEEEEYVFDFIKKEKEEQELDGADETDAKESAGTAGVADAGTAADVDARASATTGAGAELADAATSAPDDLQSASATAAGTEPETPSQALAADEPAADAAPTREDGAATDAVATESEVQE